MSLETTSEQRFEKTSRVSRPEFVISSGHPVPSSDAGRTSNRPQRLVLANFPWLENIYRLVDFKNYDAAIDVLFENIDELGNQQCDLALRSIDLTRLDTNLLVGLLSITLERAPELPSRVALVRAVEQRLLVLAPDRLAGLLAGLR